MILSSMAQRRYEKIEQIKNVLGINVFTIRRIADASSSPNVALEGTSPGTSPGHGTDGVGNANSDVALRACAESSDRAAMPQVVDSQQQAGLTAMNVPGEVELPEQGSACGVMQELA